MLGALIILSFYFFPFEITFLAGANTKMILAAIGLPILAIQLSRKRDSLANKDLIILSGLACLVSLFGLFSVVYNNTSDYTYASYIVSMWVWMSGAYTALQCIKSVHGKLSVWIVFNYLIVLCVAQCALALAIDYHPAVKNFASQIMVVTGAMKYRLYGIDASLDIAGSRFSVILVMIIHCCIFKTEGNKKAYWLWCTFAFVFIATVGNIISRTTIIGVGLALLYLILGFVLNQNKASKNFTLLFLSGSFILIPFIVLLYNRNQQFADNIRFGFEGFFSLVEEGKWQTNSNDILLNMYIFPESLKTWIIGDGYFANPIDTDPYYIGEVRGGYYMSTDVGYCRFLFYFGLLGLISFSIFLLRAANMCMSRFPKEKLFFLFALIINFIIWFKVSTDIFLVFALFLGISQEDNDNYEQSLLEKSEIE